MTTTVCAKCSLSSLIVLSFYTVACYCQACQHFYREDYRKEGNFTVVGFLTRRLKSDAAVYHNSLIWRETMRFSIKEANEILSSYNLSLDLRIYETCWMRSLTAKAATEILLGTDHASHMLKDNQCLCSNQGM